MSEASEISKQKKFMGTWEILGESIGCGILAEVAGFGLPIVGAPSTFFASLVVINDNNWGFLSIFGFCLTAAFATGTYFFFTA